MLVTIHKLGIRGEELWKYSGSLIHRDETEITIEAKFDRDDTNLEGLQLRRGDRFVETFYFDRWYNIFRIYDVETNDLKGWYCNVTRPAYMKQNDLFAEDLALDLVVLPDKVMKILDRDEFEALTLPKQDRERALAALAELTAMAQDAQGPFQQ